MLNKHSNKSYYDVLGVSCDASRDEIGRVYRDLCRVYHPDSNYYADIIDDPPNEEHAEIFKAITCAYNTLMDTEARARYDESLVGAKTAILTTRIHETRFSGLSSAAIGTHPTRNASIKNPHVVKVQPMTAGHAHHSPNGSSRPKPMPVKRRSRTYEWAESLPSISQIIRHEQPSRFRSMAIVLLGTVFGGMIGTILVSFLK